MFQKVSFIGARPDEDGRGRIYKYALVDEDFRCEIEAKNGLFLYISVAKEYEKRSLPVAINIALYFNFIFGGREVYLKDFLGKDYFDPYREDILKYHAQIQMLS